MKNLKNDTAKTGKNGAEKGKKGVFSANKSANRQQIVDEKSANIAYPSAKKVPRSANATVPGFAQLKTFTQMAQCNLYLDTRRQKKDGTYPIRVKVGSGSNLYLSTGISAREDEWDPVGCRITTPARKIDNTMLSTMLGNIRMKACSLKSTGDWERLSAPLLKKVLMDPDIDIKQVIHPQEGEMSLGAFYRKVLETKKNSRTRDVYSSTLRKLEIYCDVDAVPLRDITKMWIRGFEASMTGLAPNTVSIHLRNLRNVINCALDEELIDHYPFRRYSLPKEETRKRALDIDKFRRLIALRGQMSPSMEEYLDIYLLIFYLMGINLIDLYSLTHDSIKDGRLNYRRSKTGRLYSIRLEPEALEILSRRKGRKHLLGFADRYSNYKDYAKRLNDALRRMGEWEPTPKEERHRGVKSMRMKPIEPDLTSYWARHSWGTYASDLDIPFDTISDALGHEHTGSATTRIYIKSNNEKIDAANRKVIDWVLEK